MSVRAVVERGVARLFVELRMFFGPSRVYGGQPLDDARQQPSVRAQSRRASSVNARACKALCMRLPAGQGRQTWCLDGLAGRSRRARALGG